MTRLETNGRTDQIPQGFHSDLLQYSSRKMQVGTYVMYYEYRLRSSS
jgi:hypothetical protein